MFFPVFPCFDPVRYLLSFFYLSQISFSILIGIIEQGDFGIRNYEKQQENLNQLKSFTQSNLRNR